MGAKATNVKVRLQPNTTNTLLATWSWSKSHTDKYEYQWQYLSYYYNKKTKKTEKVWIDGSSGSSDVKNCTYSIPDNTTQIRFRVKPISKTHKVKKKKKEVTAHYWTASWSSEGKKGAWEYYDVTKLSPTTPSVPTHTLTSNNTKLNVYVDIDISGSSVNRAKKIEFQLKNLTDSTSSKEVITKKTASVSSQTGRAAVTFDLTRGKEYRVRCRATDGDKAKNDQSNWTSWAPYPDKIVAAPQAVPGNLKAVLETLSDNVKTVLVTWDKPAGKVDHYELEYTTKPEYFDKSGYVKKEEPTTNRWRFALQEEGELSGNRWYFRIRSINDSGTSAWFPNRSKNPKDDLVSLVIGSKPEPPTTWSLANTVEVGENIVLYWVHNTTDGSLEKQAKIFLTVDGVAQPVITTNKGDSEETISSKIIPTSAYPNGATIEWKVQTKGIYNDYSDDSVSRTINVVAKPTLEFSMSESNNWFWDSLNFETGDIQITEGDIGEATNILTKYPLYIYALAGPNNQSVVRWYIDIISNDSYDIFDYESGNLKRINIGDSVYSRHFDNDGDNILFLPLLPTDVLLENGANYTVSIKVVMDTGLSIEESQPLEISLEDDDINISALITIDEDNAAAYITPSASDTVFEGMAVLDSSDNKLKFQEDGTEELIEFESASGLNEGDSVFVKLFSSISGDSEETIAIVVNSETLNTDVYFSIYRINFDGTMTEIQSQIDALLNLTVIDFHPALDFARYRIVATSKTTGKIVYEDFIEEVGDIDIIIQWANERLENFTVNDSGDVIEYPDVQGEFLRLPWNIDTSEAHAKDNALVEYIGREHPVSYYGTQLGETATWNTDVDKEDTETIYALRRLAIYQGDVYVREPSGVGYWAQIGVSMTNTHAELVIPVTLTITRVEGGA